MGDSNGKGRTEILMWVIGLLVTLGLIGGGFAVRGFEGQLGGLKSDLKELYYPRVEGKVLEARISGWLQTQDKISQNQGQILEKLRAMAMEITQIQRDVQDIDGKRRRKPNMTQDR